MTWSVAKVGDRSIPADDRATVTFLYGTVLIELASGSARDKLVFDTDGSALSPLGDEAVANACDGEPSPAEREQLVAIRGTRSWRIETNDRIVLEGGSEVTLEKVPGE